MAAYLVSLETLRWIGLWLPPTHCQMRKRVFRFGSWRKAVCWLCAPATDLPTGKAVVSGMGAGHMGSILAPAGARDAQDHSYGDGGGFAQAARDRSQGGVCVCFPDETCLGLWPKSGSSCIVNLARRLK